MKGQEKDGASKWSKRGKDSSSTSAPTSLAWAGCYISCAIFAVLGFLFGGTVGVLISLTLHLAFWLLVALLRFIHFIRTP